jgi:hypothetical protein
VQDGRFAEARICRDNRNLSAVTIESYSDLVNRAWDHQLTTGSKLRLNDPRSVVVLCDDVRPFIPSPTHKMDVHEASVD